MVFLTKVRILHTHSHHFIHLIREEYSISLFCYSSLFSYSFRILLFIYSRIFQFFYSVQQSFLVLIIISWLNQHNKIHGVSIIFPQVWGNNSKRKGLVKCKIYFTDFYYWSACHTNFAMV